MGIDVVTPRLADCPESEVRYFAEEHCRAISQSPGDVVTDIRPVTPRAPGPVVPECGTLSAGGSERELAKKLIRICWLRFVVHDGGDRLDHR